jgi:hypothetical protein
MVSFDSVRREYRLVNLPHSLEVIQRITPTYVMIRGFDASVFGVDFCNDDICKYRGRIFVHLRQANVAGELARGWIRYDGLRSYTTVLGTPDTIPEFSEVNLRDYPLVISAQNAILTFTPSDSEKKNYLVPRSKEYEKALEAYYSEALTLDKDHLKRRFDLMQLTAAPLVRQSVITVDDGNYRKSLSVPRSMIESLSTMMDEVKRDTTTLMQEINRTTLSTAPRFRFLTYVQAWIELSSDGNNCDNQYYKAQDILNNQQLTPELQPWCALHYWTRYKIPTLNRDGTPIQPDWWNEYEALPKSAISQVLDHGSWK